jgi:hypothetical protein
MEMPQQGEVRHFRYDAIDLRGKRMRLMDELPTSDAGHIQESLRGVTDVICLDDTPNVMHDLRVHPVGRPDVVAPVEFRQLAIYDEPTEQQRKFAADMLLGLLHEIEVRNASAVKSKRHNIFKVSHAWTEGSTMYLVYTAPPSDRTWGLARDTRWSLINPSPWNDTDDPALYYYLLDLEENWPGRHSSQPGEPETIWWNGGPLDNLIEHQADIPDAHRYTSPPDPSWVSHDPPVFIEPRRYTDPRGPSRPLPGTR